MKANKWFLPWILLSLCLFACQGSPRLRVTMFVYDSNDTFMASFAEEMEGILDGDFDFSVSFAEREQAAQTLAAISAIEEGTDALIINLVDRLSAGAIIEKAYREDVPIVFANRKPLSSDFNPKTLDADYSRWIDENCFYVGSHPLYEGRAQAEIANAFFGGPDKFAKGEFDRNGDGLVQVAVMKGEQGHQDAEERTSACLSGLEELGYSIDVVKTAYGNWERQSAFNEMASFPIDDIELLFSNNDDMALGVVDYLKVDSSGKEEKSISEAYFPIVGVDATAQGREAVDQGDIIGTVVNDARGQCEWISKILSHLLKGEELGKVPEFVSEEGNYYYVEGGIYSSLV